MEKKNKFTLITGPNGDEFYDDCPICRVTKKAREEGREPTEEELKEAFLKSKEQGAIVGGEWLVRAIATVLY